MPLPRSVPGQIIQQVGEILFPCRLRIFSTFSILQNIVDGQTVDRWTTYSGSYRLSASESRDGRIRVETNKVGFAATIRTPESGSDCRGASHGAQIFGPPVLVIEWGATIPYFPNATKWPEKIHMPMGLVGNFQMMAESAGQTSGTESAAGIAVPTGRKGEDAQAADHKSIVRF